MATSARLDELKKKFDENPRRYFAPLANEYRKLGDLTQAVALCRAHLPNQPGHISGHIVLAQALYEARELGEARSIFEAALDLDPENLIALRYLGDIAREQDEPQNARTWYERVLEADPRNEEIAQLLKDIDATPVAVAERPAPEEFLPGISPATVDLAAVASQPQPDELVDAHTDAHTNAHTDGFAEFQLGADAQSSNDFSFESSGAVMLESPSASRGTPSGDFVTLAASPVANDAAAFDVPGDDVFPEPAASAAGHHQNDDPFFGTSSPDAPESHDPPMAHDAPMALGELEAVAEPSVDDWFGAPASEPETTIESVSDPAAAEAFDDSFFPDLASATPVTVAAVPELPAFAVDLPVEIDVRAQTPPFVRADEGRPASIPTPPFLAALDASDALPAAELQSVAPVEPAPEFSWSAAPTPVDTPAIPAWDSIARVAEDAAPTAEATAPLDGAAEWSSVDDSFDLVETSAPVSAHEASGDLEPIVFAAVEEPAVFAESEAVHSETTLEDSRLVLDDGDASGDDVARPDLETPEVLAVEVATVDAVAPAPGGDEVEEPTLEVDVIEEPVSAVAPGLGRDDHDAIVAEAAPALGMLDVLEADDDYAGDAAVLASGPVDDGLVVEYGEFVPPEMDATPFIAASISVPFDEPDAYSAGAPTLSAHELFPMETDAVLGAAPSSEWSELPADEPLVVAPVAGFVAHELPLDDIEAPVVAAEPEAEDEEPSGAPAFVTETMAELYLQQGFHDEALSIYRQLLAQQPDDRALRDRVAALERGAASAVVDGIVPRDAVDRAGQSVRSFFSHFARREPRQHAAQQRGSDDDSEPGEPAATGSTGREPSFSGVATREEALTVPDTPAVAPTLTQLFAAGAVSMADERAAAVLSSAFGAGEPSPAGQSGGKGERELSLEHLFRDVPARSSGAVTLDEFYHGSSTGESDPASHQTEDADERGADIEQFTAWLEGLKKK